MLYYNKKHNIVSGKILHFQININLSNYISIVQAHEFKKIHVNYIN